MDFPRLTKEQRDAMYKATLEMMAKKFGCKEEEVSDKVFSELSSVINRLHS